MMKRISPGDLPPVLTTDVIEVLANMAIEIPQSKEWHQIFDLLSDVDYRRVADRGAEIQRQRKEAKLAAKTEKERVEDEAKSKAMRENMDPDQFYGNMGQPETIEEYKRRYGEEL